ncbi:MAG: O-antigen ligase family protein, partial [Cyanobacteria bacterium J06588_4]
MNKFKNTAGSFWQCLTVAPLPIIALIIYMGLRSSAILDGGLHLFNGSYHPSYFGWYDLVLAYAIVFSFLTGSLKPKIQDSIMGLVGFFIISASWINTYEADHFFIAAGLICFCRFFLVFVFARSLVCRLDYPTAESVLLFIHGILVISAIFWYSLQFGEQNRLAASAMTSASFGQVCAIMCLLFYARKNYLALFSSFILLFLSFSRTSLLLFILLIVIQNRQLIPLNLLKYAVVFFLIAMLGIRVLQQYGGTETQVVLESRFSTEEIANLNGRTEIWSNASEQIRNRHISPSGIGFHMTPSLIKNSNLKFFRPNDGSYHVPPHYHNLLIEYTLSLGAFSLVIFFYLLKRIWQAFQSNSSAAYFIYAFFFGSQIL